MIRIGCSVGLVAGLVFALESGAVVEAGSAGAPVVPGQVVVKFRPEAAAVASRGAQTRFSAALPGPGAVALDALLARHRVVRMRRVFRGVTRAATRLQDTRWRHPVRASRVPPGLPVPDLEDVFLLELADGGDPREAAADLASNENVVYARPNYVYRAAAALPDRPFVPDDRYVTQDGIDWSEGAWGQAFPDLWGLRSARAIEGWNVLDEDDDGVFDGGEQGPGEGIVVAVVDSGLDAAHPEIAANVWTNPGETANGLDDDGNGFVDDLHGWDFVEDDAVPDDDNGHGTHVSGTIAAVADNAAGVAGVAPYAKILPVKGLGANGSGSSANLAAAVQYAADAGADVLSNSWGGLLVDPLLADAFAYAHAVGAVSVAAAGNDSMPVTTIPVPAALPDVITVAAVDVDDHRASFSNFGYGIDVSAAGVGVLSLDANGGANTIAGQVPERVVDTDYLWLNGTSMACPHVAGAAAVLLGRSPTASAEEIQGRLMAGAHPIDAQNPGFEAALGAGTIDLEASLLAAPQPVVRPSGVRISGNPFLGGDVAIAVSLRSFWQDAEDLVGTLSTASPWAVVVDGATGFGDLPRGAETSNDADPFVIAVDPATPTGTSIALTLDLAGAGGYAAQVPLAVHKSAFQDVTEGSGLRPVEVIASQIATGDVDGNGLGDLAIVGPFEYRLLRNAGGGVFEASFELSDLVTESLLVDADADADHDLFLGLSGVQLYRNPGDGVLGEATPVSEAFAQTLMAFDADRDGLVDLLAGGSVNVTVNAHLLHNGGDGSFTDVIAGSGIDAAISPYNMTRALDFDDDGDADVLVLGGSPLGTPAQLYRNDGGLSFTNVTPTAFAGIDLPGPRQAAVGDYDDDGDLDLYVSGIDATTRHALLRNDGDGTFSDVTASAGDLAGAGVKSGGAPGTAFFDYDNDGDLDLYAEHGKTDPPRPNTLYRNDGGGDFTDVTAEVFPPWVRPDDAAAAILDMDGDGALDLYAPSGAFGGNSGGAGALLKNWIGTTHHWIRLDLRDVYGNRDAYGARVSATAQGLTQLREVHTGPVEANPVHFGLGDRGVVDEIRVRWPSGRVQRLLEVAANRRIPVLEPILACPFDIDANGDGACDDVVSLTGTAAGGSLLVSVAGVVLTIPISAGEDADTVLGRLADAIRADPTLAARGIRAVRDGPSRLATNGRITALYLRDPGLTIDLASSGPPVPTLAPWAAAAVAGALLAAGVAAARRRAVAA